MAKAKMEANNEKISVQSKLKKQDKNLKMSNSSKAVTEDDSKLTLQEAFTSLVDELKNILECTICRERYLDPQMLPCQHIFCAKCIDSLLIQTKNDCPICRKQFKPSTQRNCLLMNNLIEFASKHPSLVVAPEPTPPIRPQNYVLDDDLPEDGDETEYESDFFNFSDAESYIDYDEENVSMNNYLIHHRFADFMMFMSGDVSDDGAFSQPRAHNQRRQRSPPATNTQTSFSVRAGQRRNPAAGRRTASNTQKIFRRCSDWPTCNRGDACMYTHPWRQCRYGAFCPFGDSCCFLHEIDFLRLQHT